LKSELGGVLQTVHQLSLTYTIAAADVIAKRVHKLQKVELQVRFLQESTCKPADTLKVSDLPEGTSEDILELYFENPKSGGCEGAVKSISFHGPTTACIQFTSDESKDTL
jgi:hypothetical protein